MQTEKSGTLGTGNDQTIFTPTPINLMVATRCKALGRGTGFGVGEPGDPANTISAAHSHGVFATAIPINDKATRWQGAQAGGVGYSEEVSPTLAAAPSGTNQTPAVMAFDTTQITSKENGSQPEFGKPCHTLNANAHVPCVALDMTHACDVIRECGEQVPALQARMGTCGNQVPLTYQMNSFGDYRAAEVSSSCKQRDFKDSTDLVCVVTPDAARAVLYQPKSAMEENWAASETKNALRAGESKVSHAVVCEDVSHVLRAKANCAYREDAETYPVQNMVVRRLTPLECTRLQGYPDGWVDIGDWTDENGKKHKDADSPKYKALGNSIALPFWDWMLRRMARYLPEDATLGSLFDGIAGFPLIWERIHGRGTARWASEIEQFPIAVTKKWFGEE